MEKLTDKMLAWAGKLDSNKYLSVIKDALLTFLPMMIIGSFASLFNTLISSAGLTDTAFGEFLTPVFSVINFACVSCMTLGLVFFTGYLMSGKNKIPKLQGALTAFVSFITIINTSASATVGEETVTITNLLPSGSIGASTMLIGFIGSILCIEFLTLLMRSDKLKIKMPDSVPPMIATSFNLLIPVAITVVVISVIGRAFVVFTGEYLPDLFYTLIQKPLEGVAQSPAGALIMVFVMNLLWVLGIHGGMATRAIRSPFLIAALAGNIAAVEAGGVATNFFTESFWGSFVVLGGAGYCIALLVSILLFSKREDYRAVAKLGLVPSIFGINEPVIYGLPIVLNPVLGIPFIIVPLVTTLIGYISTQIGFMPCAVIECPVGLPVFVNTFVGYSGSWQAMVTVVICFVVAIALYTPFVIMANKQAEKEALAAKEAAE